MSLTVGFGQSIPLVEAMERFANLSRRTDSARLREDGSPFIEEVVYRDVGAAWNDLLPHFESGKLVLQGRKNDPTANMIDIVGTAAVWLTLNGAENLSLSGPDGLRIYDPHVKDVQAPASAGLETAGLISKGGRPEEYLWSSAVDDLCVYLGTKGFPETYDRLIAVFSEMVLPIPRPGKTNDAGRRPSSSSVNTYLSVNLPKLKEKCLAVPSGRTRKRHGN